MKRRLLSFVTLPLLLITGCEKVSVFNKNVIEGSGEFTEQTYNLDGEHLSIKDLFLYGNKLVELNIKEGEEKKIVITADEDLLQHITIKSDNKDLKIFGKYNEKYKTESFKIDIYGMLFSTLNLEAVKANVPTKCLITEQNLSINGSYTSNIRVTGTFETEHKIDFNISGASKIIADNMKAPNSSYYASGTSEIYVANESSAFVKGNISGTSRLTFANGSGTEAKYNISGASKLYSINRTTEDVTLAISGASFAEIKVTENLKIDGSGSSTCYYSGSPKNINKNLSGGSRLGEKTK